MSLSSTLFIVAVLSAVTLVSSATQAEIMHGYVVDADGRRVQGARVQVWHIVPTDQLPPRRPKRLGETTTDRRGNFALSADPRQVNMVIASFDNRSGAALPSFAAVVRVVLRHNRPRPIGGMGGGEK